MKNLFVVLVPICGIFFNGCALYQAIKNDPFRERTLSIETGDDKQEILGALSLSADRRTVLVRMAGDADSIGRFCAEPPPDIAKSLSTLLSGRLKIKNDINGSFRNDYNATVVKLADRTSLVDVYRTGTYALCQYHLNSAISNEKLINSYNLLTEKVIEGIVEISKGAGLNND